MVESYQSSHFYDLLLSSEGGKLLVEMELIDQLSYEAHKDLFDIFVAKTLPVLGQTPQPYGWNYIFKQEEEKELLMWCSNNSIGKLYKTWKNHFAAGTTLKNLIKKILIAQESFQFPLSILAVVIERFLLFLIMAKVYGL